MTGLGGLTSTMGMAIPYVGVGLALLSGFKKKTKVLDEGLRVQINGTNALAESYKKVETSRFWGLSKKVSEEFEGASGEVQSGLSSVFKDTRKTVVDYASNLGVASNALDGFSSKFKISIKDMTDEQALAEITKAMTGLQNEMSAAVLGTSDYIKSSETATQALARMSEAITTTNPAAAKICGFHR